MAEIKKVNKKIINDPLYSAVVRFLKKRIQDLEANGPKEELDLAHQRYTGIIAGDLSIENPISFPDGHVRVCFVSRKTGFARVDVDIDRVTLREVLEDFKVKMIEVDTLEDLITYVKANKTETDPVLFDMKWANKFGVKVTQADAKSTKGPMKALGDMFFSEYTIHRQSETYMDPDTLESGTVDVSDMGISPATLALFIHELIVEEVDVPELRTNLPPDFNTHRSDFFKIPMTIWFGNEDITLTAGVVITTAQGYTNPKRSDDLLYLEGQTIYGAADREVRDDIIVRVTHMYNGREVKKTFRMTAIIEPDAKSKLTFEVTPETVEAQQGDEVGFTVKAFYEGVPLKIAVPPSKFVNEKKWGDLTYVSSDAEGVMTYRGVINGRLLPGQDQEGDLYSCEFQHMDAGVPVKAKAYLNAILKAAALMPQFVITKLDSTITGYALDTGMMSVEAKYGDDVIPADQLGIRPGNKGDKQLIRFNDVITEGVNYTLLADSGTDGLAIEDDFEQQFIYKTPTGVRKTINRTIRVTVKRDSVVTFNPEPPVEKIVNKYDKGGLPFQVLVNGVNRTADIKNLKMVEPKNQIRVINDKTNTWQCLATEAKDAKTSATYTFDLEVDRVNKRLTYVQPYLVKTWTGKEVVAIPGEMDVKGDNHANASFTFTLYRDDKVISSKCIRYPADDVIPSTISINRVVPIAQSELVTIDYTRKVPGKEDGRIAVTDQSIATPTADQVAWIDIKTDVTQARILEVIDKGDDETHNVDVEFPVPLTLHFAGQPITLADPKLKLRLEDESPFILVSTTADNITLVTRKYRKPGTEARMAIVLKAEYDDAGKKVTLDIPIWETIVYPAVVISNEEDIVEASIWESGKFKIHLKSGIRDFANNVTKVEIIGEPNKYISVDNAMGWKCFFAELTPTPNVVIPLRLTYRYGSDTLESDYALIDVVFNIAEWDGITFAGFWDPDHIDVKSGEKAEVIANFQYLGEKNVAGVTWDKDGSIIPDFTEIESVNWVEGKGYVITIGTTRGGEGPINLVFVSPDGKARTTVTVAAKVAWPVALNIVSQDKNLKGYHTDDVPFGLVLNYSGIPVPLNDPKLTVTVNSGTGNPIALKEKQAEALLMSLVKGGEMDKDYNYTVTVTCDYKDGTDVGKQVITFPAVIRVPVVIIGGNPSESVKIFDEGVIRTTLVDERGKAIAITSYAAKGVGTRVEFAQPKNWKVTSADTAKASEGKLPMTFGFSIGGNAYKVDGEVLFNIAQWDGKTFKATTETKEIFGDAGTTGELEFEFEYRGKPITGVTLDKLNSSIPGNIVLGELTAAGKLPYTLRSNGRNVVKFIFVRPGATGTVPNVDVTDLSLTVTTRSTTDVLTLASNDPKATGNWMQPTEYGFVIKYGEHILPLNSPGLTFKLKEGGDGSSNLGGASSNDHISITPKRSEGPETVKEYTDTIIVSFDLGDDIIKTLEVPLVVEITTGKAVVTGGAPITTKLFAQGTFDQGVEIDGVKVPTITFIKPDPKTKYVDAFGTTGWEIVAAEPTTSTQDIPTKITYVLDGKSYTLDTSTKFTIAGSTEKKFYVVLTPENFAGVVDVESTLNARPVYKGKNVGAEAKFMEELSTIPDGVTLVKKGVNGVLHELTFISTKSGVHKLKLVWHSPAGDDFTTDVNFSVMAENPKLEVIYRQPILPGKKDGEGVHIPGVNNEAGMFDLQLSFGGVPLPLNTTQGTLSISIANDPRNAKLFNLQAGQTENQIPYILKGILAPGAVATGSDYLQITYALGSFRDTIIVEVPIEYKTGPVTVSKFTGGVSIWNAGSISPVITCQGVSLLNDWVRAVDPAAPNKYIKITDKTWECILADETKRTEAIPLIYTGSTNGYSWEVTQDSVWNISAWDQIIMKGEIGQVIGNGGELGKALDLLFVNVTRKGRNVTHTVQLSDGKSDYKDMWEFDRIVGQDSTTFRVSGALVKSGKEQLTFALVRQDAPADMSTWVLNDDYILLPYEVTAIPTKLIPTVGNVVGKSGGKAKMLVSAKYGNDIIRANDPNLVITTGDNSVIKPTGVVYQDGIEVEITATSKDVTYNLPAVVKLEYTSTGTPPVTAEASVNIDVTIQTADDYPVFTPSPTINVKPWDTGKFPFKVMAGGTDVSGSVKIVSITNYINKDPDASNVNGWRVGDWPDNQTKDIAIGSRFVMEIPYKGETLTVEKIQVFNYVYDGVGANPKRFEGKVTPHPIDLVEVGHTQELEFEWLYTGLPHTTGRLFIQSGTDVFDIMSQRIDNGKIYLTVKTLKTFASVNLVWYYSTIEGNGDGGATGYKTVGQLVTTAMVKPVVKDVKDIVGNVWDNFSISDMMSIYSGSERVDSKTKIVSITSPNEQMGIFRDDARFVQIVKGTPAGESFKAVVTLDYFGYIFTQEINVTSKPYLNEDFVVKFGPGQNAFRAKFGGGAEDNWVIARYKGSPVYSKFLFLPAGQAGSQTDLKGRLTFSGYGIESGVQKAVRFSPGVNGYDRDGVVSFSYNPGIGQPGHGAISHIHSEIYTYSDGRYSFDYADPNAIKGKKGDRFEIKGAARDGRNVIPMNKPGVSGNPYAIVINFPEGSPVKEVGTRTESTFWIEITEENDSTEYTKRVKVEANYVPNAGTSFGNFNLDVTVEGKEGATGLVVTDIKEQSGKPFAWKKELPFTLTLDGTPVLDEEITTMKAGAGSNNRFAIGYTGQPTLGRLAWYNANPEASGGRYSVIFDITVTRNGRTYTVSPTVVIVIGPWNGHRFVVTSELKEVKLRQSTRINLEVVAMRNGFPRINELKFLRDGSLKPDWLILNNIEVIDGKTYIPTTATGTGSSGGTTLTFQDGMGNTNTTGDGTAYITDVKFYSLADKVVLTKNTTRINGKKGDIVDVLMSAKRAWDDVDFTSDDVVVKCDKPEVLEVVGYGTNRIAVKFVKELQVQTENQYVKFTLELVKDKKVSNEIEVQVVQTTTVPMPVIYDVKVIDTKIWETGPAPFKVKDSTGADLSASIVMTNTVPNNYVKIKNPDNVWEIINADKTASNHQIDITFDVVVEGIKFTMSQQVLFNIVAWDGITIRVMGLPQSIMSMNGEVSQFTFSPTYRDEPAAGVVVLDSAKSDWKGFLTIISQSHDKEKNLTTIGYRPLKDNYSENCVMYFRPTGNTGTVEGLDYVNVIQHFNSVDPRLSVTVDPNSGITGPVDSTHFVKFTIRHRGIVIPANDPGVEIYFGGAGTNTLNMRINSITADGVWFDVASTAAATTSNPVRVRYAGETFEFNYRCIRTSGTAKTFTFEALNTISPATKNKARVRIIGDSAGTLNFDSFTLLPDPFAGNSVLAYDKKWVRVGEQADTFELPMDNGHTGDGFRLSGVIVDDKNAGYKLTQGTYPIPKSPIIASATPTVVKGDLGYRTSVTITIKQKRFDNVETLLTGKVIEGPTINGNGKIIGTTAIGTQPGTYVITFEGVGKEGNTQISGNIVDGDFKYPFSFVIFAELTPEPERTIAITQKTTVAEPATENRPVISLKFDDGTPVVGATLKSGTFNILTAPKHGVVGSYSNMLLPVAGTPGDYEMAFRGAHIPGDINITLTAVVAGKEYPLSGIKYTSEGTPVIVDVADNRVPSAPTANYDVGIKVSQVRFDKTLTNLTGGLSNPRGMKHFTVNGDITPVDGKPGQYVMNVTPKGTIGTDKITLTVLDGTNPSQTITVDVEAIEGWEFELINTTKTISLKVHESKPLGIKVLKDTVDVTDGVDSITFGPETADYLAAYKGTDNKWYIQALRSSTDADVKFNTVMTVKGAYLGSRGSATDTIDVTIDKYNLEELTYTINNDDVKFNMPNGQVDVQLRPVYREKLAAGLVELDMAGSTAHANLPEPGFIVSKDGSHIVMTFKAKGAVPRTLCKYNVYLKGTDPVTGVIGSERVTVEVWVEVGADNKFNVINMSPRMISGPKGSVHKVKATTRYGVVPFNLGGSNIAIISNKGTYTQLPIPEDTTNTFEVMILADYTDGVEIADAMQFKISSTENSSFTFGVTVTEGDLTASVVVKEEAFNMALGDIHDLNFDLTDKDGKSYLKDIATARMISGTPYLKLSGTQDKWKVECIEGTTTENIPVDLTVEFTYLFNGIRLSSNGTFKVTIIPIKSDVTLEMNDAFQTTGEGEVNVQ